MFANLSEAVVGHAEQLGDYARLSRAVRAVKAVPVTTSRAVAMLYFMHRPLGLTVLLCRVGSEPDRIPLFLSRGRECRLGPGNVPAGWLDGKPCRASVRLWLDKRPSRHLRTRSRGWQVASGSGRRFGNPAADRIRKCRSSAGTLAVPPVSVGSLQRVRRAPRPGPMPGSVSGQGPRWIWRVAAEVSPGARTVRHCPLPECLDDCD